MKLSILFQGSLAHLKTREQQTEFVSNISYLRKYNPDCEILISTWEGEKTSFLKNVADKIILNKDPGSLPGLKFDDKANNINRLIISSKSGLSVAKGELVVKLRSDLRFYLADIVNFYYEEIEKYSSVSPNTFGNKIITTNLFTLEPKFVERMPYHISDWIQIGEASDIKKMWDIELYDKVDALYYNFNKFAKGSNHLEKQFQSKLAVEQYLTIESAKKFGKNINVNYHNDYKNGNSTSFYSYLISNYIVKDMRSLKLINDKYKSYNNSLFFRAACISESRYDMIFKFLLRKNKFMIFDYYGFILSLTAFSIVKIKSLKLLFKFITSIFKRI